MCVCLSVTPLRVHRDVFKFCKNISKVDKKIPLFATRNVWGFFFWGGGGGAKKPPIFAVKKWIFHLVFGKKGKCYFGGHFL